MAYSSNPLTCAWGVTALSLEPDYGLVEERYGKAGLFKANQTVEDVSHHRMQGIVAVICDDGSAPACEVMHRLNALRCLAICPSDFDSYFPSNRENLEQKSVLWHAMLDQSSELLVVPFPRWRLDAVVWRAVKGALQVNKRVSVLHDRTPN